MHYRLMIIGAVLLLLPVACGPVKQAPAPSPEAGAEGQPKYGGMLNLRIPLDPYDWDVTLSGKALGNGQNGHNLADETLLAYQSGPGVEYSEAHLIGDLAERWEMSPDGKTFTFHLRQGLKWPDIAPVNGRAFTAQDVKFSYEYQSRTGEFAGKKLTPGTYAWYFEGLDTIETPDDHTVVVRFKQPFLPFPYYAASGYNVIMPREIYDRDGNFSDQLIGMGPFQISPSDSQAGSKWVFKKNPNYYQPGRPYMDGVNYLVIADDSTAFAAFQTKQLDALIESMTPHTAEEQHQVNPDAQFFQHFSSVADWRLYVNTRKSPLDNVHVRRAISLGIDREDFLKTLGEGKYRITLEGVQPGLFSQEEIEKFVPYDPDRARQELAAAGYSEGLSIEMTYPGHAYGDQYITGLQLLQAQLKTVGIDLQLLSEDKGDWNAKRRKGDYYLGLQQASSVEADMDSWLFGSMYSKSRYNYNGINDPEMDRLVLAQRAEPDPEKRRALLRQIVTYMMNNVYSIPIGNIPESELWQPYVHNYAPFEFNKGTRVTDVWLQR